MLRFTIIPLFFLFGGLFFSLLGFFIYRKIKKGITFTIDKSSEISSQFINKLKNQEERKTLPKIVQTGFDDFENIEASIKQLPPTWQLKLLPLKIFIHTLDAFKQFAQKLQTNHALLTNEETKKAEENIQVIYDDLLHHETLMQNKRKFEFDVLMDVIKARLKK